MNEEERRERAAELKAEQKKAAGAELDAMAQALDILHPLPRDSQQRALRWIAARLDNFPDPVFLDEVPF